MKRGADINAKNNAGQTPLAIAISGDVKVIKFLKEYGVRDDARTQRAQRSPEKKLGGAIADDNLDLARKLLSKHPDLAKARFGHYPLHLAESAGMTELLIERGADVNARTPVGETPLHFVAEQWPVDWRQMAELLLKGGADINAKNNAGQTPLAVAASGDVRVIKFLKEHGAKE